MMAVGCMAAAITFPVQGADRYTVLHRFPAGSHADSTQETPRLLVVGNTIFGATRSGGSEKKGTLYRIGVDGTGFTALHDFTGTPGDGRNPTGALTTDGDAIFGLTTYGGKDKGGIVFRVNKDGTGYNILHNFYGWVYDGDNPFAGLTADNGFLYGLSSRGGTNDAGVIFRLGKTGNNFALLHHFTGDRADGGTPFGSLLLASNVFYGVTNAGSQRNKGVLFRINQDGSGYQILHRFTGNSEDGANPTGTPVLIGNQLFGLTTAGGACDKGTLYRIGTDGTGFTLLRSFGLNPNDGEDPQASLLVVGNTLVGSTRSGGRDAGVIFQVNTTGKDFTVLHRFDSQDNTDGAEPYGDLILVGETLYGLTRTGGNGAGVLFRLNGVTP